MKPSALRLCLLSCALTIGCQPSEPQTGSGKPIDPAVRMVRAERARNYRANASALRRGMSIDQVNALVGPLYDDPAALARVEAGLAEAGAFNRQHPPTAATQPMDTGQVFVGTHSAQKTFVVSNDTYTLYFDASGRLVDWER